MSNLINSYSLSSVIGIGTDTPNQNLTVVGGISGNALVYDQTGNSSQWNSVYTSVKANSGSYATSSFVQSNYLNLTGGTVNGNVTFTGNISAQGTATFANTIFTTTSALCAIANSNGPALYIGQQGSGDLASFYDLSPTPVEVLHIGASIGIPGVGIYTSTPNKELTVVGEISATKTIYASGGNSNQWNNVYSYVNSTSATNNPTYNATNFSKLSSQAYTLYPSTSTILPTVGNNQSIGSVCSYIGSGQNNIICAFVNNAGNHACNYNASIFSGCNNTIFACSQGTGLDTGAYICNTFIGGGICNSAITNTGADEGHIENSTILNGCCNSFCLNSSPGNTPGSILNSTIVGGCLNALSGYCIREGVIGGGYNNKIISSSNSDYSLQGVTIAGGSGNTISGCYASFAIIGGGQNNCNCGSYGVLVGGNTNCITSICGGNVIVGGTGLTICGYNGSSFIGGGYRNTTSGYSGADVIVGGSGHTISAYGGGGFIGGGSTNKICGSASNSVVVGGASNTSSGGYASFVGAGQNNTAVGNASVVVGGLFNTASGNYSFIGGGCSNNALCVGSTISGGYKNTASHVYSNIIGGSYNRNNGVFGTITGAANTINAAINVSQIFSYWKLPNSALFLTDTIAGNNNLIQNGTVVRTTGIIGGGIIGNNTGYLTTTNQFSFGGPFTINYWTIPNTDGSLQQFAGEDSVGLNFNVTNTNIYYGIPNVSLNLGYNPSGGISTSSWSMATLTRDDNSVVRMYLNGVLIGSVVDNTDYTAFYALLALPDGSYVGNSNGVKIAEVGVWYNALPQADIAQLYNKNIGRTYPFTISTPSFYSSILGGQNNTINSNNSFVAAGSGNVTAYDNTFVLGSNITTSQPNYTYVNNIKSLGLVADGTGNSNQWNSVYTLVNTTTATTFNVKNLNVNGINVSPYAGMRNRIINGDFYIDQRKSGANSLPASTSNLIDRWKYNVNGTPASKIRVGQNINGVASPAGFTSYYGLSVVATSTPGSGDYVFLSQVIEGPNTIDLNYGTSSALSATLSFYVRSSRTGNFGGFIRNYGAFNRSYPFLYNIPVSNTWTYITVPVPGDTTGTWTPDTSHGIEIGFEIANGSTYQATAGAWTAGNYTGPSGATTLTTINNSTFYVTGVQFEPGIAATPYERRNYGIEYAMCQRYYEILEVRAGGYNTTGNGLRGSAYFRVQKRPSTLNATVISTDESFNLGSLTVDNSNYRYDSARYITAVTATGDAYGQWQVSIDSEF